jgi:hypothetical protein
MVKKYKTNKSQVIRKLHDLGHDQQEIHTMTNYSKPLINIVLRNYKKKAKKSKIVKAVEEMKEVLDKIEMRRPKHRLQATETDLVNHPPHYRTGGVETIDFIEAKDLNYRLGNVVKYVSRAGKKDSDPVQDLEKAAWYLQREITARKGA